MHLEDILDRHVADPMDLFLRGLSEPGLREIQLQIRDYCSRFPCGEASECSNYLVVGAQSSQMICSENLIRCLHQNDSLFRVLYLVSNINTTVLPPLVPTFELRCCHLLVPTFELFTPTCNLSCMYVAL